MKCSAVLVAGLCAFLPLTAWAADASPLHLDACDDVVRAGVPFRCRVVRDQAPPGRGPWVVHVALEQGGRELASQDLTLDAITQIRTGLGVVLIPPTAAADDAILRVVFADSSRAVVEQQERRLPTPGVVVREANQAIQAALAAQDAPLPRLWSEQLAELAHLEASARNLAEMSSLIARCGAWTAAHRVPGSEPVVTTSDDDRDLIDPVDGSVQPWRLLWAGPGTPRAIAVVLGEHPSDVVKARWGGLPPDWIQAATTAGIALAEVYPAGDRRWRGIGWHRARLVADAARAALNAPACPVLALGVGDGAAGAVALAERAPLVWRGVALVRPRLLVAALPTDGVERWLALHLPGQRPENCAALPLWCVDACPDSMATWRVRLTAAGGQLTEHLPDPANIGFWRTLADGVAAPPMAPRTRIVLEPGETNDAATGASLGGPAAYADGPFVVVVGTAEHAAAVATNQSLAEAFVAAWSHHAHGRPPVLRDQDFRVSDWPRHHLVCIGNPRSNTVLADLFAGGGLPLHWDDRTVSAQGFSRLRSLRTPIALDRPHPAGDGRWVVVLDGAPAWNTDGLPLAGLPDVVVGDAERPIIWTMAAEHQR
jgi:hypothetical protein